MEDWNKTSRNTFTTQYTGDAWWPINTKKTETLLSSTEAHKQPWIRFLPDECVDFGDIDVIQLLDSVFDLMFVCLNVHYEHKCVVVFNFLHCRLRCQGELDDGIVIQPIWERNIRLNPKSPPLLSYSVSTEQALCPLQVYYWAYTHALLILYYRPYFSLVHQ